MDSYSFQKKYFETVLFLFLVLVFLLSFQLLSVGQVKGDLISSSISIDDNVDPLDGLESSALFSNVSVIVDAGPIDLKNLTVSLKEEFSVEGDLVDVQITLNLTFVGDVPENLNFSFLVFLDSDLNPKTGHNTKALMLNGLGADWSLGYTVEDGIITSNGLEMYNESKGSFEKVGYIETFMRLNQLGATFFWGNIGKPDSFRFMTYIITENITDLIPNIGLEPPLVTFEFFPIAVIDAPDIATEGSELILEGSGSTGYLSEIISYSWDLDGDGDVDLSSEESLVIISYSDDGDALVTLFVETEKGLINHCEHRITILNVAPYDIKIIREGSLLLGEESTFFGTATDPGSDEILYSWDFGDGATAKGPSANHSWGMAGQYTIVLTVTDDDGGLGSTVMVLTIEEPPPPPPPPLSARVNLEAMIAIEGEGSRGEYSFNVTLSYDDAGTNESILGVIKYYLDSVEMIDPPFNNIEITLENGTNIVRTPWWEFDQALHNITAVIEFQEEMLVLSDYVIFEVEEKGLNFLPVMMVLLGIVGIFVFLAWDRIPSSD